MDFEVVISIIKDLIFPAVTIIFSVFARSLSKIILKYLSNNETASPAREEKFLELQTQVELLKKRLNSQSDKDIDKEALNSAIASQLIDPENSPLLQNISSELKKLIAESEGLDYIRGIQIGIVRRLSLEILALGKRANVNLVIGVIISSIGILSLLAFLFQQLQTDLQDKSLFLYSFLPKLLYRLLFVIFVELFAYFFLRLYRTGIEDIKYFQNEITNAEFRLVALEYASRAKSDKTVERLCLELIKIERNFILRKGETTIALASEELSLKYDGTLPDQFAKIANIIKTLREKEDTAS